MAWPDDLPLAPIAAPCADRVEVHPAPDRAGASFRQADDHRSLAWEHGLPALDDGEWEDGRVDDRAVSPAPATFGAGLPSLIPPSTRPDPASTPPAPGPSANDPPLRC